MLRLCPQSLGCMLQGGLLGEQRVHRAGHKKEYSKKGKCRGGEIPFKELRVLMEQRGWLSAEWL